METPAPPSRTKRPVDILEQAIDGVLPTDQEAIRLAGCVDTNELMRVARALRDNGHGDIITYSRKVFIPLTKLCRDVCHYCTFAQPPNAVESAFLPPDAVLEIARAGKAAGCKEALFTLGDKPELRYRAAREQLERLGHCDTLSYVAAMAELVLRETGLLPHLNPGLMTPNQLQQLRNVSASMGIMLETASERLSQKGGPHFGSPDKDPQLRLATIAHAGAAAIPFTSGILIGIGETRTERIEALLALRASHRRYGHVQEVIIQNFRAKPGTRMAAAPEPSFEDHLWTIAVARILLGPAFNIQAPPNLGAGALERLIAAGINDWGGISPVTIDHVNPEAPWPNIDLLARKSAVEGKILVERLAVYPEYVSDAGRWISEPLRRPVLELTGSDGRARLGRWVPGTPSPVDGVPASHGARNVSTPARRELSRLVDRTVAGSRLDEREVASLFAVRGEDLDFVCRSADELRRTVSGDTITYVVNRNINYTNICYFRCQFCAFSKGKLSENLRGIPYDLALDEVGRRVQEAWERGATEVCLQGGIHPSYSGDTYLAILRAVKNAAPDIHVHAFSPLEVWQGAKTLSMPLNEYLGRLVEAGLGSLPGTAAEILDDEVRRVICPDKINTGQWLEVMRTAHSAGLRSTATIMFGHVDRPVHWARHLLLIRDLQAETGGFTEFVPLPFVPMETPIYLKGRSRRGPSLSETLLMHAIARLVLNPLIGNVQTSWVKMGVEGAKLCLSAGANDLGGSLMNETISRAAGASFGQEMAPARMEQIAAELSRAARQRTTLYAEAPAERRRAAREARELEEIVLASASPRPQRVRAG